MNPIARLLAFVCILASAWANAGNNLWSRIGPPGGGVSAIQFSPGDPSDLIGISQSEVVTSIDGGRTWRLAYYNGSPMRADAVAAAPSRYYALNRFLDRIYVSTDNGVSWAGKDVPFVVEALAVDAVSSSTLYARILRDDPAGAFVDGLYGIARSTDAGSTWTILPVVSASTSVYDLLADPQRPNVLYAGIRGPKQPFFNAYYKSVDGGASWQMLAPPLPGGAFARLSIDPSRTDTLYVTRLADGRAAIWIARSTDGGVTWRVDATNLAPGASDEYVVVPDPLRYGTLYETRGDGFAIFRSVDFGVTWSELSPATKPAAVSGLVVPHPTSAGALFAATPNGLFRTDNDGAAWTRVVEGLGAQPIDRMEIDEPKLIVRTSANGYYATTDQANWAPIPPPVAPVFDGLALVIPSFGETPWSPHRIALRMSTPGVRSATVPGRARVYRTGDDGATWSLDEIVGADVPDYLSAIVSGDPQRLFGYYDIYACGARFCFVTDVFLTRSTDGGTTWQTRMRLPELAGVSVASGPGFDGEASIVLLAQHARLLRSIDGGETFAETFSPGAAQVAAYADPHHAGVFYLASCCESVAPRLYRSTDGGLSWSVVALQPALTEATGGITDMRFSATRPQRVDIVASSGLLFRSEDAGNTFRGITPGPGADGRAAHFGRHEPATVYVPSAEHGVIAYTIARDAPVDVVEFYNTILDHYFITAAAEEATGIDRGAAGPGWIRTGRSFRAWIDDSLAPAGVAPVCRFYGTPGMGPNSHFYTIDPDECAAVQRDPGWRLEAADVFYAYRPAGGACPQLTVPVYRAYDDRFAQNDSNHRYAVDRTAYDEVLARGWIGEGLVMCAEP